MECVICLDPLTKSTDELVTLHCGHLFHNSCLVKSLERNPSCPTCRKAASKKQIIKLYLPLDIIGAAGGVGQCKDCVSNRKQLEEALEQSNRLALEHSKLIDKEFLIREYARHLENRNDELIERIEKHAKEQQLQLEGHKNEKEKLMAQIDAMSKQNNELKEENQVLVDVYREQITGKQLNQAILDAHSGEIKTMTDEVEILRERIKNLTEEQQSQADAHKNEKEYLMAQIDAITNELKGSVCAKNSDPEPDAKDCQKTIDNMVTPPKLSVESIEEILVRWGNEKAKRGRQNRSDPDNTISVDMIPVREYDSDSDKVNPVKRPVCLRRCGARFFSSGSACNQMAIP